MSRHVQSSNPPTGAAERRAGTGGRMLVLLNKILAGHRARKLKEEQALAEAEKNDQVEWALRLMS